MRPATALSRSAAEESVDKVIDLGRMPLPRRSGSMRSAAMEANGGTAPSIHIPLVTVLVAQPLQVIRRPRIVEASVAADQVEQGPLHVGGHVFRVAADVEMGAAFEPAPDLLGLLADFVLHVD